MRPFQCPKCGHRFSEKTIRRWWAQIAGAKGIGPAKARSRELASKAGKAGALARWGKKEAA